MDSAWLGVQHGSVLFLQHRSRVFNAYFRRAAAALPSAPDERFAIVWIPGRGKQEQDATHFYLGDDVVDVIGPDVYDSGYHEDGYLNAATGKESCSGRR